MILKGGVQKVVVIARGLLSVATGKEGYFDYGGCLYPQGLVGDQILYFNHRDIVKVVFSGFHDDDDKMMVDNINQWYMESPYERTDVEKLVRERGAQDGGNSAEERRKRARVCEARSEKSAREREKAEKESKRAANEKNDRKIKKRRETVSSRRKISAKAKRKKLEKYANGDEIGEWIGKEQTATVYSIEGNVVGQYNTYIERIDDVVDALCNEITRLENENMQLSWDVLHIGSLINSLVNEIRTLCN